MSRYNIFSTLSCTGTTAASTAATAFSIYLSYPALASSRPLSQHDHHYLAQGAGERHHIRWR